MTIEISNHLPVVERLALMNTVTRLATVKADEGHIPAVLLRDCAEVVGRSPRTLQRLVQNLIADGTLPSGHGGRRPIQLTDEQVQVARTVFMRMGGDAVATHQALEGADGFPQMSTRTFQRLVASWPAYLLAHARGGYSEMMKLQGYLTETWNHRAECFGIDHTKVDVRVWSRDGKREIFPWLTIVVDEYSAAIVSFGLFETQPDTEDSLGVLADAFQGRETPDGLFGGVPGLLLSDNGGDFKSNSFRKGMAAFGVTQVFTEPYSSFQNGRVERTNGTIEREFAPTQPGFHQGGEDEYTRRVLKQAMDNRSLLTMEKLEKNFTAWVEQFNSLKHPQLKPLSRMQVWHTSPHPLTRADDTVLKYAFMNSTSRRLNKDGVALNNERYQHEELAALIRRRGNVYVDVRFTKHDPTTVGVFFEGEFVCAATTARTMSDAQRAAVVAARKAAIEKAARYTITADYDRAVEQQAREREQGVPEHELTPLPDRSTARPTAKAPHVGRPVEIKPLPTKNRKTA